MKRAVPSGFFKISSLPSWEKLRAYSHKHELPTWGLIIGVYGSWISLVSFWRQLPLWASTPLLILSVTWYLSLQHEIIHGHPTSSKRINALFAWLPLAVWYPFPVYRHSHLVHHRNENLTLPGLDPESHYRAAASFTAHPQEAFVTTLHRWKNTTSGRLIIGPAIGLLGLFNGYLAHKRTFPLKTWVIHIALLSIQLIITAQYGINPLYYVFVIAYSALSITSIRSFYEHRYDDDVHKRSILQETSWPWRLLFLNLNYHLIHHLHPGMPWYQLHTYYLKNKEDYQAKNGYFIHQSYFKLLWNHWRKPVIPDYHPLATQKLDNQPLS